MKILKAASLGFLFLTLATFIGCDYTSRAQNDTVADVDGELTTDIGQDSLIVENIKTVNFYLENSGSINGYLNGNTDFKRVISRVLRNLELEVSDIQLSYINTEPYPFNGNISEFLSNLTPSGIGIGNTTTSDLNLIFETVLANTSRQSLGIMISDGIYSVSGDRAQLLSELEMEADATRNEFIRRLRNENIETIVVKMSSNFNGRYHPAGTAAISINQNRPYYIWLFGQKEVVRLAKEKIRIQELPGYIDEAHYFINSHDELNYSVIHYKSLGRFQFAKEPGLKKYKLVNVEPVPKGQYVGSFGFSIAANLSKLPLEDTYITNRDNYTITDGWQIDSIVAFSSIRDLDNYSKLYFNNSNLHPTHLLFISTHQIIEGDINIGLSNQEFPWVLQTGSDDDSTPDELSTFGFDKLMGGISDAYLHQNNNENYFNIKINIKR